MWLSNEIKTPLQRKPAVSMSAMVSAHCTITHTNLCLLSNLCMMARKKAKSYITLEINQNQSKICKKK